MIDKNQARLRRARKTRAKIAELKSVRLSVHRTNSHIYAQVFSPCGSKVLAAASSLEPEVRTFPALACVFNDINHKTNIHYIGCYLRGIGGVVAIHQP